MTSASKDVFGEAIQAYKKEGLADDIHVESEELQDDLIPVNYLFRSYDEMPQLEKLALDYCKGKILDVGAGAGPHALHLSTMKKDVYAIDTSEGSVEHLRDLNIPSDCLDVCELKNKQFDTILLLMNGIGIGGDRDGLRSLLNHLKTLLSVDGCILFESTDISYLYDPENVGYDDDGYGVFHFRLHFEKSVSDWFKWIYLDYEQMSSIAEEVGMNCQKLFDGPTQNYLGKLTVNK